MSSLKRLGGLKAGMLVSKKMEGWKVELFKKNLPFSGDERYLMGKRVYRAKVIVHCSPSFALEGLWRAGGS
jgi:hypothetical protein